MQAIERYGVVALLLLIGTVVAVLVWDGTPVEPASTVAAAERPAAAREPARESTDGQPETVRLSGRAENRGLRRGGLQQVSMGASAGLVPETGSGSEELTWNPPPQAYRPDLAASTGVEPRVVTTEFHPQQQPEYWEPEPQAVQLQRDEPRSASSPARGRSYRIKRGDTLGQIALDQLGTSKRWREIVALNPGLNEKKLYVDKQILLPAAGDAPAAAAAQETPRAPAAQGGRTYTVQSGDNLWKIAARTLGDRERWREIKDLNPNIDPDKILVGQRLELPAGAPSASTPVVASSRNTGTPSRRRVR